ncbi:MAG: MFS transporter [bacterium]|nr:MFS transporter [bacterium]
MRHHSAPPRFQKQSHILYTIAVIGFIYALHLVLPLYSNSSFLSLFTSEKDVGIIYMIGSAATILGFLFTPFLIRRLGNYATTLWLIIIQASMLYGLATVVDARLIALFFVLQVAIVALIGFCLDIFLEVYSDTSHVGMIRGMYLTSINCAWIVGPLIGSMIIGEMNDYRSVYVASLFMLIPLFYLVFKNFPKFKDPHYRHPSLWKTIIRLVRNENHSRLFAINTILQVFYAWMVVYSPIYLHTVMGLSWSGIGIVLTVMLLPFPLLQLPLGKIADKKYGEKEIMVLGFALLGLSTIALAAIISSSVFVWALALFITRMGAASAEIMIETYFFKTVDQKDPNILGFFRITRSISYFIAPLITGFMLIYTEDQSYMFIVIGTLCLLAMIPAWKLKDTN